MNALKTAGLRLDPDKYAFGINEVKYLGFIIETDNGVKLDPDKVEAVAK